MYHVHMLLNYLFVASALACEAINLSVYVYNPMKVKVYEYFNTATKVPFFSTKATPPDSTWTFVREAFCVAAPGYGVTFVPFHYWWRDRGNGKSNNYYTLNNAELGAEISPLPALETKGVYDFRYKGLLGYISNMNVDGTMKRLYRSYQASGDNNSYLALDENEVKSGQQTLSTKDVGGYLSLGAIGWVWSKDQC